MRSGDRGPRSGRSPVTSAQGVGWQSAADDESLPLCVLLWCGRAWSGPVELPRTGSTSAPLVDRRLGEEPTRRHTAPVAAEDALLAELARGDERALEALYLAHERRLHRVAYRYVRSAWAARAVVQDVFAAVWYRRASLSVRTSIESYLSAAVRKRALAVLREELRRGARDARWSRASALGLADGVAREDVRDREREPPPPQSAVDASQEGNAGGDRRTIRAEIGRALLELPTRQRLVYELRVERRLTNAEVRLAIGAVSVKAVEMLYARAVKALRRRSPETQGVCREGSGRSAET